MAPSTGFKIISDWPLKLNPWNLVSTEDMEGSLSNFHLKSKKRNFKYGYQIC